MIEHQLVLIIALILAICLLIMVSQRVKVAYPIMLVLGGVAMSFIPGMPRFNINPDLIFLVFLPPILYDAAMNNSWKELWRWRKVIGSFAFIVVFITALVVGFIANTFIPGFSVALGFLLGGIVSPPDAVSAAAIMKFVKVPRRISAILEGESLFNDASSLIIVKFALIAIGTGQFVWYQATASFVWMVIGGAGVGVLLSYVLIKLHKWLPMDENIDTMFTILSPYVMYISAETVEASGVLAVVSGGLYFSYRRILIIGSSSRLRSEHVWNFLIFLLNGMAFLLIGLDLPEIMTGLQEDDVSIWMATAYGLLITMALVVIRMGAAFSAVFITRFMSKFITVADSRKQGYAGPLVLGWTGMRGVVSLAAALSIPLYIPGTQIAFPERSLVLYITFMVITLTLIFQGLTLPVLLKMVKLPNYEDHMPHAETQRIIRIGMAQASLDFLERNNMCEDITHSAVLNNLVNHWNELLESEGSATLYDEVVRKTYREILEEQRLWLNKLNKENERVDEELVRHFIHRIDLEEERLLKE
ncbi:MAG: Na+/H+ antiporter [Hoylesella shahii]|uniref:Na+/H+ antiporter n=1 Tax=Hoylesella shahii TaxID=228603 RepID=UPI003FA0815C